MNSINKDKEARPLQGVQLGKSIVTESTDTIGNRPLFQISHFRPFLMIKFSENSGYFRKHKGYKV